MRIYVENILVQMIFGYQIATLLFLIWEKSQVFIKMSEKLEEKIIWENSWWSHSQVSRYIFTNMRISFHSEQDVQFAHDSLQFFIFSSNNPNNPNKKILNIIINSIRFQSVPVQLVKLQNRKDKHNKNNKFLNVVASVWFFICVCVCGHA